MVGECTETCKVEKAEGSTVSRGGEGAANEDEDDDDDDDDDDEAEDVDAVDSEWCARALTADTAEVAVG